MKRLRIAGLVGCLAACQAETPAPPQRIIVALPALEPVATFPGPENWKGHGGIAVSTRGKIAFVLQGKDADPRLAFVDSTGQVVVQFSRSGEGPGEVRAVGSLWFDGDTLGAFDLMAQRASRFDASGGFLTATQLGGIGQPYGGYQSGLATVMLGDNGPDLTLLSLDGDKRSFVDRDAPAYDTLVVAPFRDRTDESRLPMPALAATGDLVAYADAWSYRVAWARNGKTFARYGEGTELRLPTSTEVEDLRASLRGHRGPDGRAMDPGSISRQVEHFASTPVAQFDRRPGYGMAFDGQGRLWIPREVGDSVAWDILSPGQLLGTLTLPCGGGGNRGRSVNGSFLLMECESGTDSVPLVKLWRIE